ncbi:CBS domain-containing protein [Micromonospora echinofusca]|uniref:restriction system modified-DNA reader domain-containing protein n=1 Tax=Micromonospora echinofusca TaxID=47858 RepID=UPI0037951C4B
MSPNPPRTRREVLLNGRRVRIFDLIRAGRLQPGTVLEFRQYIGSVPHRATVTEKGRLRLTDGREFDTPSGAAAAAADLIAAPGWEVWRVAPDGPFLGELRLQLIKSVAAEVTDRSKPEAEAMGRRMEALETARHAAEAGTPTAMTARELIELWGVEDRDSDAAPQIATDLANFGLTTVPDFNAVDLDQTVRLLRFGMAPPPTAEGTEETTEETTSGVDEETGGTIGLTLGNLLPSRSSLASVTPTSTFDEAITAMELDDFSQLPVLANPYKIHGVVSWKTITKARAHNPEATFSDAIDPDVHVFDYDRRLIDVLHTLLEYEFIFVRNHERKIAGIITAADVVRTYHQTATPFILIGEIDRELHQLILDAFDEARIRDACVHAGLTFDGLDKMSISHYHAVLGNEECWNDLGWRLQRKRLVSRLNEIREIRNRVMHFSKDAVRDGDVEMIQNFLKTIRRYNGS